MEMDKKILAVIDVIIQECEFELVNGKLLEPIIIVLPYSRFLKSDVIADRGELFKTISYVCTHVLSIKPPDTLREALNPQGSWIIKIAPQQLEQLMRYKKPIESLSRDHRITLTKFIKEILSKYKFPKKQRKLLKVLSNGKPHDTKFLKTEVGTKDLASLKISTLDTIKAHRLSNILIIKRDRSMGKFASIYSYQLEIHPELFQS